MDGSGGDVKDFGVCVLDTKNNLIIAKGKPITSHVTHCAYDRNTKMWNVTFQEGKTFRYNYDNIEWLKNPTKLNPKSYHISHKGKTFDNVTAIYSFSGRNEEYWHICFSNMYENDYSVRELCIERSCLEDDRAQKIFSYLRQIAENTDLKTEDDSTILVNQYKKIDFIGEKNALAVYLNPNQYYAETGLDASLLIFPFGCNQSQYHAVEQAILNHVSVIEGPPGTGKTQTILNIIANLLIRKKTVQVVSNNNSAIENIIEKLSSPKYGLDFFVASLGRAEKKQQFLDSQTACYPDFSKWRTNRGGKPISKVDIQACSVALQTVYEKRDRLARLMEESENVKTEQKHFLSVMADLGVKAVDFPKDLSSAVILRICQELEAFLHGRSKMGFWGKLRFRFMYGVSFSFFESQNADSLIPGMQMAYYRKRLSELHVETARLQSELKKLDADKLSKQFEEDSLCYFRKVLSDRYNGKEARIVFEKQDLWMKSEIFLKEYPVVLSTTYSARSCLGKNAQYDYVIMDEASQVDVATGALALSCARHAVIVGDCKQLPNIVTKQQEELLEGIFKANQVPMAYDCVKYSFLSSICSLLEKRIPRTILREHYRCDPLIIGYCNRKFYHNELIVMTEAHEDSLELVTTVAGNHMRERTNLRQAEVIKQEVLPTLTCPHYEIGIISPYRSQAELLKSEINDPEIEIATVHKFQGREKDVIIFSTTDDIVSEFSDNQNLLNVAVSRAKKKLIVVASEMEQPIGSNVGDLIGYIRYYNGVETHSAVSSVFDYLYSQNRKKRLEYLNKHRRISEFDSENLFFSLIEDELKKRKEALGVICHQPLYLLFRDLNKLNAEEVRFVRTGLSHLDFLIYNNVTKRPLLAIEVDGYRYHKSDSVQGERDRLKNHILEVYHLPLIRFKTNGSGEQEILQDTLNRICGGKSG